MHQEWHRGEFTISTDRARLNIDIIHRFLSMESYWAVGRPRAVIKKSIEHSLNFGVYHAGEQIGFARIVTDYATFAWLADVFILSAWRKQGLSKWLMSVIIAHPDLQGLRRWILSTRDAHGLYRQFGFEPLPTPDRFLCRFVDRPDYSNWSRADQ